MRWRNNQLKSARKQKSRQTYKRAAVLAEAYRRREEVARAEIDKMCAATGMANYTLPDFERWFPEAWLPKNYKRLH
jgi:hypothetical protein